MPGYNVDEEIVILTDHIKRLGRESDDGGVIEVTFKQLFDDDQVANSLESLAGTLKAAKKRKVVSYGPELLLQGMSDNEIIKFKK